MASDQLQQLLMRYRAAAAATQEVANPGMQNAWHDELQSITHRLSGTDEGSTALKELMYDADDCVRLWAAVHCMDKYETQAVEVLVALRDGGGPYAFDAKWTLRSHEMRQNTIAD
jgi:hypothetical protein